MHIGGAVQGLQHVVYDPPPPPVAPAPPANKPVKAKEDSRERSREDADPRGYNPVTDLIERLVTKRAAAHPPADPSVFVASAPARAALDIKA